MAVTAITVEVLGERYTITCQESAISKLDRAAQELVAICDKVQQSNTSISRTKVLVVAALNLAAQLGDSKKQSDAYSERMQLLSEKIDIIE